MELWHFVINKVDVDNNIDNNVDNKVPQLHPTQSELWDYWLRYVVLYSDFL